MERDDDATLAGWHRDPSGRHELRFWDGTRWTEHVVSEGIPGHDHPTRSGRPSGADAVATPTPAPPPMPDEPAATAPVVADAPSPDAPTPAATIESVESVVDLTEAERPPTAPSTAESEPRPTAAAAPSRARAGRVRPESPAEPSAGPPAEPPAAPPPPRATPVADEGPPAEAVAEVVVEEVVERPAPEPVRANVPRLVAEPPSVASPAGRSSGSNTSAIADPHRFAPVASTAGRVVGVSPVPVKRYRPGSPPASPYVRPRALTTGTGPIGTVITPWYRKASGWLTILLITAIAACVVIVAVSLSDDGPSGRLSSRPPAAAPAGTKVIEGNGVGIAAPRTWVVTTDPGGSFGALRREDWGTPLVATNSATDEALIVVPLHHLAHDPQVDPALFWSDQIRAVGTKRTPVPGQPLSVHGFRANQVSVTTPSEPAIVAASIDTGDQTFLVAVTATTASAAANLFDQLIQTFDPR